MKAPKGGRMIYEPHPDLTFWGKADAEGTFAYTKDSTCGGSGASGLEPSRFSSADFEGVT